jgi:hypothetical protein
VCRQQVFDGLALDDYLAIDHEICSVAAYLMASKQHAQ